MAEEDTRSAPQHMLNISRVKDIDFGRHHILSRDTKGNEDRVTLLPELLASNLHDHVRRVKAIHEAETIEWLTCLSRCNVMHVVNSLYSDPESFCHPRSLTPALRSAVAVNPVVVLTGARQVGKNTLAEFTTAGVRQAQSG